MWSTLHRAAAVASAALASVVLAVAPASAGGGAALIVDREFYEPGGVVVASSSIRGDTALGSPEGGPYGVWILPLDQVASVDWPPARSIERGRYVGDLTVEVTRRDPNGFWTGNARIAFTLPYDLESGEYALLHCNYPCTRSLGDLIGTVFRVGPPPPPPTVALPPSTAAPAPAPVSAPIETAPRADDVHPASALRSTSAPHDGGIDTILLTIGLVVAVGVVGAWRVLVRRRPAER